MPRRHRTDASVQAARRAVLQAINGLTAQVRRQNSLIAQRNKFLGRIARALESPRPEHRAAGVAALGEDLIEELRADVDERLRDVASDLYDAVTGGGRRRGDRA